MRFLYHCEHLVQLVLLALNDFCGARSLALLGSRTKHGAHTYGYRIGDEETIATIPA